MSSTPPPASPSSTPGSSSTDQKSWSARISEATDAIAQEFVESVSYDWRLYKQDIAGSIAHATMLAKVGLITEGDREAIERGLREIEAEIDRDGPGWKGFKKELEDIHMCVESELTARIGEPGRRLHTGRSRNDQVAFDIYAWLDQVVSTGWMGAINDVRRQIGDLVAAFVFCAERNADVVMPSYTHLQRAQPISAAAECLAWTEAFETCSHRFGRGYTSYNPLGSGAIAGTSLPIDREETCSEVGGENAPSESSIYSTANRDQAIDFVFACAMTMQWLSRWAEQWIIYMSTEFGFIRIADRYTTSSSMMPQKRNPDMLELIRGRCGNVYGDLFALMTILKGLPIGYNRDLQEDKRIVFRAYDTVSQCLTMAAAIVNSASYDRERIEPTLERGFLDATSLAEYLVTKGVPFRTAHHIVGTLVARCEKEGKHALSQLPLQAFNEVIATKSDFRASEEIYSCLGARNVVSRYQSAGAAGGKPLEEQLKAWKERLGV